MSDDIKYEIEKEFDSLMGKLKDLEIFIEENIFELSGNVSRDLIDTLLDSFQDFIIRYDDFLSDVISIAGEVRGFSRIGANIIKRLENIKEMAIEASKELEDLRGIVKEQVTKNQAIEDIKRELMKRINQKITAVRQYVIEQVTSDLMTLARELEKIERYYEETG